MSRKSLYAAFVEKKCEQISMKYYRSVTKSSLLLGVQQKSINYAYELFSRTANKMSYMFLLHCFSFMREKGLHFMIFNAEEGRKHCVSIVQFDVKYDLSHFSTLLYF